MSALRHLIVMYISFSFLWLKVVNVCDSNTMEKQLYSARPEIIQQLVRLLHNDSGAGLALKTIVLKTLRTMARNSVFASNRRAEQSRFHQVLNSLGSNLNHGILMTLLRENVALLQLQDPSVEEIHYSQALHRLVREFLESPQGASNLGFAGIIPLLVDILKIERKSVWNIVVTIADLLATLLPHQRHNQLLPLFMDADGLGVVIHVIKVPPFTTHFNTSATWITIFPIPRRKKAYTTPRLVSLSIKRFTHSSTYFKN
jgi:Domain of Unknown Function (DUF908)